MIVYYLETLSKDLSLSIVNVKMKPVAVRQ